MQIDISYIVTMIFVLAIIIIMALIAYRNFIIRIIKERNFQHELEIKHQKNITLQCIKTQEEERERIAIKLHDDVCNKLNILSVWLNNPLTWNKKESKEIVLQQIPDLIENTRTISYSLFPTNIERFGLVTAIDELITNIEPSLLVELTLTQKYNQKDITTEIQIYRIIQEFLNNVIKHSMANNMLIKIRDSAKSFCISLSDNGKGFDINKTSKGMGLRNIEMRVDSIGALFKWKNKLNEGSKLIIMLPKNDI